jgi:hypothetical protein
MGRSPRLATTPRWRPGTGCCSATSWTAAAGAPARSSTRRSCRTSSAPGNRRPGSAPPRPRCRSSPLPVAQRRAARGGARCRGGSGSRAGALARRRRGLGLASVVALAPAAEQTATLAIGALGRPGARRAAAAPALRNAGEHLLDVVPASGVRGLRAGATGGRHAHVLVSPRRRQAGLIPPWVRDDNAWSVAGCSRDPTERRDPPRPAAGSGSRPLRVGLAGADCTAPRRQPVSISTRRTASCSGATRSSDGRKSRGAGTSISVSTTL